MGGMIELMQIDFNAHTVAIIPARGGSKGIPRKNLIDFCGKPLLAWSIIQVKLSQTVKEVYVSSDSDEILAVSEQYGAIGVRRPDELATDTATSESALLHALDEIERERKGNVDLVVFLQCTSPLREPRDIDGAVQALLAQDADSLFSYARLEDFFIWEQTPQGFASLNYDFRNRKRRQDVNPQYVENGSIYVFRPEILRKFNNRLGGKIAIYEMDFWKSWEIDSLDDKSLCEWYMRNRLLPKSAHLSIDKIDLIVYDFDGVMTDNKVIVLQDGTEGIVANRGDGLGIGMLRKKGIPQIIISTEANPVVETRAKKLELLVWYDAKDKKSILQDYCSKNGISLSRVVYVGNDVNDLEAMKIVGYPIATADAHPSVRQIAKLVLASRGGDGVIRELADTILE